MGFFLTPTEVAEQERAPHTQSKGKAATGPRVSKRLVQSGERGCDACELKETWKRITSPRMPVSGNNQDADIMVLGEGPGAEEDAKGQIFVGKTGTLLRRFLSAKFTDRLAFQNAVRCRPDDNRTPTAHEMYCCSSHLDDDIARLPIKAILGVGGAPLARWVYGARANITAIHGTRLPIKVGEKVLWYFPVFHPSFVLRLHGDKGGEGPAMPVFQADLRRFFAEVDSWPKPKIYDLNPAMVTPASSQAQVYQLLDKMKGPIALDLETTSPYKGMVPKPYMIGAKVITAAISDGKITVAWQVDGNDWGLETLLTFAENHQWIAHSASYELIWLLHLSRQSKRNRTINTEFNDTMVLARLYHQREKLLNLGIVSRIHLGINVKQILDLNTENLTVYTLPEILQYNGLDALATILCYHKMIDGVKQEHYHHLLDRVKSTVEMELMGLDVSEHESHTLRDEWSAKAAAAEAAAKRIYEVREYERVHGEFSISTPQQVGEVLVEFGKVNLPKTPKGKQYQTDDEVLNDAAPDHPLVKAVLKYREATKINGTYIDVVLSAKDRYIDGRIHPSYTVTHTATLRTSSSDPNAQNWPMRKHREVRRQIVAPEGHVLVAMDYGQIQVRILGMVSDDRRLCENLLKGVDTHTQWLNNTVDAYPVYLDRLASKTGQTNEAAIRKYGRNIIKTDFVFNSFFGGGVNHIAHLTGMPIAIVRGLQGDFWSEFRGVKTWHNKRRTEYKDTGSIRTPSGYVRHGMMMGNEPLNTPIQAGEAEIVLAAQNALHRKALRTGDMYWHPRLNIHDDLSFILPDDDRLVGYIEGIAASMLKVRYPWQTLPLTIECKVGPNWCDLEEVYTFTGPYIK